MKDQEVHLLIHCLYKHYKSKDPWPASVQFGVWNDEYQQLGSRNDEVRWANPCSVKAYGNLRVPPQLEIPFWNIKSIF